MGQPISEQKKDPKLAVVLSSGGLKPVSSIALFEFLEQEQIDIDLIVGCSGGSIMGGLWNVGYDPQEMLEITKNFLSLKVFSNLDYQTILSITGLPFGRFNLQKGLLKNKIPLEYSREVFKDKQIESLPIEMILQTTNIQTGEGVILDKGPLGEAVYASSAMYPLVPPFQWEGKWLVDGAYCAPLPILEAVKRDADIIIAMLFNENLVAQPTSFLEGFNNTIRAFSQTLIRNQLSLAIDLHHFEIIVINVPFEKPISMSDPKGLPELIDLGRRAVDAQKEEILQAIAHFSH